MTNGTTLYFSPLACSMATRILAHELELELGFVEVCPFTKRTRAGEGHAGGDDYLKVHPLGVVPALRTSSGDLLTENVAVLWHLTETAGALPPAARERHHVLEALGFVATELHKTVFAPIFDRANEHEAVRAYAATKAEHRLGFLETRIGDHEFLVGDSFGPADAYLVTVLHWAQATPVTLPPKVLAYLKRHLKRPSVAAAIEHELPLFVAEQKRKPTAA